MASQKLSSLVPLGRPRVGGLKLATIRQQRGLSLEQIAETTKISLRFLRAIEAEDFGELPGGIFSTSYLRQYAKCIDCDESVLIARYREKMNRDLIADSGEPPSPGLRSDSRRLLPRWFRR